MNDLYLIVALCGERVAFRAADVKSVIELKQITPTPMAPAYVAGLTALRSRALTVIDCARSLGEDREGQDLAGSKAVVVELDGHVYALAIDEVDDVIEAEASPESVPAELTKGWQRVSQGMVETELGAMLVVDLTAIIAGPDVKKAA